MSLIKCIECGNEVSEFADTCPKCGCPVIISKNNNKINTHKIFISGLKDVSEDREYDLTDFDKMVDEKTLQNGSEISRILIQKYGIKWTDAFLISDIIAFNNNQIPADYNEVLEKMRASNRARRERAEVSKPKCPMCGSTNISKISTLSRASSIVGFGILSKKIGKQWQCNNPKCKHMW